MATYHIAQLNIGKIRAPLDDPQMAGFMKRLAYLDAHGPTQFAFTFNKVFQPDEEFQRGIDWAGFKPCPATT